VPKLKHPGLGALTTIAHPLIRLMPAKLATRCMALLASGTAGMFTKQHVMDRNLRAAFPEKSDAERLAIRKGIVANFGRLMAEIVHMPTFAAGAQGTSVEAVGATEYTFGTRGQAIYVSAHLGNWEVMPLLFERAGLPLTIIYSLIGNAFVDETLAASRSQTGSTYVEKSQALRACFQAMKRGESVAFLVDQRVDIGIDVEFFGRPTTFTHLPARLALKFGCPIVPGESRRLAPGRLQVVFNEPIWPATEDGPRSEQELTQLMARAIEGTIRRQPEAWICNKSRWRKADLEASPAAQITSAAE
jgi:KDO2-lipid IV(A) lauroyltransferase